MTWPIIRSFEIQLLNNLTRMEKKCFHNLGIHSSFFVTNIPQRSLCMSVELWQHYSVHDSDTPPGILTINISTGGLLILVFCSTCMKDLVISLIASISAFELLSLRLFKLVTLRGTTATSEAFGQISPESTLSKREKKTKIQLHNTEAYKLRKEKNK